MSISTPTGYPNGKMGHGNICSWYRPVSGIWCDTVRVTAARCNFRHCGAAREAERTDCGAVMATAVQWWRYSVIVSCTDVAVTWCSSQYALLVMCGPSRPLERHKLWLPRLLTLYPGNYWTRSVSRSRTTSWPIASSNATDGATPLDLRSELKRHSTLQHCH